MNRDDDVFEKITLRDIENMINILKAFIRMSKKAERLLSALAPRMKPEYEIARALIGMRGGVSEEEEEVELSEEELRTLEKIRRARTGGKKQ